MQRQQDLLVLLACSLQIGAIIGGASDEDQQRIYYFGLKLGLLFQIKDDWLDAFGESAKVGNRWRYHTE
jgi:geranylgeranyl diphosphate synthase type II